MATTLYRPCSTNLCLQTGHSLPRGQSLDSSSRSTLFASQLWRSTSSGHRILADGHRIGPDGPSEGPSFVADSPRVPSGRTSRKTKRMARAAAISAPVLLDLLEAAYQGSPDLVEIKSLESLLKDRKRLGSEEVRVNTNSLELPELARNLGTSEALFRLPIRTNKKKRMGLETRVALREERRKQLQGRGQSAKAKSVTSEDRDLEPSTSGRNDGWNMNMKGWKHKLLLREEEAELMPHLQGLKELEAVKAGAELSTGGSLSEEDWARAAKLDLPGLRHKLQLGNAARLKLVECNLRMVMSFAHRYRSIAQNLSFIDVCHFGLSGLIRAAILFDPAKGFRFSSYAFPFIQNAVRRSIFRYGRTISLPLKQSELKLNVKCAQLDLLSQLGRFPTDSELANHLGVSEKRIQNVHKWHDSPMMSLESGWNGRSIEGSVAGDALIEQEEELVELDRDFLDVDVDRVLNTLHPKESEVLRLSMGFDGNTDRSFADIAREINMSREMVRRYFNRGMLKLQHPERAKILEPYMSSN